MFQYIKQNKHVIVVSVALFIVSMSALLFFLEPGATHNNNDHKASVLETVDTNHDKEKKYREILNNQEDPVIVLSIDGKIEFVSSEFEKLLGHNKDELTHQSFFELLDKEDLTDFLSSFGQILKTKESVTNIGPYKIRDINNNYHLHIGSAAPIIEDEEIEFIVISTKDISESVDPKEGQAIDSNDKKIKDEDNKIYHLMAQSD